LPRLAVGLVADARSEVAVRDVLVADLHHFRLGFRDLLLFLADEVAEVALARKAPELADIPAAVDRRADRLRGLELGQLPVALVDRDEVVGVLVPGEMEVRLLVELGDEAVGVLAERVELTLAERGRHGPPRIPVCRRSLSRPTEKRSS